MQSGSERQLTANGHNTPKKKKISTPGAALGDGQSFLYTVVPEEFKHIVGAGNLSVVSFAALIAAHAEIGDLERVVIDGHMSEDRLEIISRLIHPVSAEISAIPDADRTYPLVNTADAIARCMYRMYTQQKRQKRIGDYNDHLVVINIAKYARMLDAA